LAWTGRLLLAAVLILLSLLAVSCGGGRQPSVVSSQSSDENWGAPASTPGGSPVISQGVGGADQPGETTLDEALAELDALPIPEGVDEAVFSSLKSALREALLERVGRGSPRAFSLKGFIPAAPEATEGIPAEEETARLKSRPTQAMKLVATPPEGPKNLIDDLTYSVDGEGVFTLTWSYRNVGDYNQDGMVNVQDLTPLAVHFHEYPDADSGSWLHPVDEVIDGNADGAITIADITPLAANFFVNIDHYNLMAGDADDGPFEEAGEAPLPTLTETPTGRRQIAGDLGSSLPHFFWCVMPVDFEGNEGEMSNVVQIVVSPPEIESISPKSGHSGDELEVHAVITGTNPKSVTWDFGGGAVPNTTTERTATVTLGDEGRYTASLSVTSPYGEDSMNFTLTVGPAGTDWMLYTVDTGIAFYRVSLAVIDGRPAIAYNDGSDAKYAICSEADGSGQWNVQTFASELSFTAMPRLAEVSASPAVLITRQSALPTNLTETEVAFNETADGSADWQFSTIGPAYGGTGIIPSLLLFNGRLAAFFGAKNGAGINLSFALNTRPDGMGLWDLTEVETAPPEERMSFGRYTSAALVGGLPAVAYHSLPTGDYWWRGDLHFAINSEADASGEWNVRVVEVGGDGIVYGEWPSLAEVDGRPAIVYDRWNHSAEPMTCYVKYAINIQPDGSGHWNRFTVDSSMGACEEPSLTVVGGRPAIAYTRGSQPLASDFVLVYAENSAVDGTGAWTYRTVDNQSPAGRSPSLALVDGRPAIAYVSWDLDEEGTSLKFAIRTPNNSTKTVKSRSPVVKIRH